jgi:serine/threonine-protein kinase
MVLPAADDSGAVLGRYKLLERLGAGGMAIVYRALAQSPDGSNREVVIKRVLPELSRDKEFSSMLVAEARLSSRLHHPNIVEVYELGKVGDEFYLSMELVDGFDLVRLLNTCLKAKKPLPVELSCHIAVKMAEALAYAHDLKDIENKPLAIVHRDVTPSNVMVNKKGEVKLLDFGVAKAADRVQNERTRTGTLKGKVNYLSPESAEGLPVDRRTDIFSLGIGSRPTATCRPCD